VAVGGEEVSQLHCGVGNAKLSARRRPIGEYGFGTPPSDNVGRRAAAKFGKRDEPRPNSEDRALLYKMTRIIIYKNCSQFPFWILFLFLFIFF
jgi:hypothetical protein